MKSAPPTLVRVTRHFAHSQAEVFDAWLEPARIERWMFGPALREEEVLRVAVDGRVGGSFSFLVRRDGEEIDHVGSYLVVERPRRLAFTWGIAGTSEEGSPVTIDLTPADGGCDVTLTHELPAEWADYADRTEEAWAKMLETLAANLDA